jgi:peptidoglycan/LPS O-acetylase OafA/YrhL
VKAKTTGTLAIAAVAAAVVLVLACCRSAAVEAAFPVERANASLVRRAWRFVRGAWRGAAASAEAARLRRDLAALAVLPLVFAAGPGSAGSRSLGVTLFGGYAAYAALAAALPLHRLCDSSTRSKGR